MNSSSNSNINFKSWLDEIALCHNILRFINYFQNAETIIFFSFLHLLIKLNFNLFSFYSNTSSRLVKNLLIYNLI